MNVYTSSDAALTFNYYIGSTTSVTLNKVTFDCALVDTSLVTHTLTRDTVNSSPLVLSSGFDTVDFTTFQIDFNTADRSLDTLVMIYQVSAYISSTRQTLFYTYTVTLKKYDCENVVITTSAIGDTTFDIRVGDNFELAAVNWPQTNQALCPFTITLSMVRQENMLSYNTIKKIDVVAPIQFSIQSNGLTLDGTYIVTVSADVPSVIDFVSATGMKSVNLFTDSFVILVPSLCTYNQVTKVPQNEKQLAGLGQAVAYQAQSFVQTYPQCTNLAYSVTGLPSFISFDAATRIFNIFTVDNTKIGIYTIQLTCIDSLTSSTDSTLYQFEIVQKIYTDQENLMDYYIKLKDQDIMIGQQVTKRVYKNVYRAIQFFNVFSLSLDFGQCSQIVKYDNHRLVITADPKDIGMVCDLILYGIRKSDKEDLSYLMNLKIIGPEDKKQTPVSPLDMGNGKITAKIVSITHKGQVTIRFNDTLELPKNISILHLIQTLRIQVRDGINKTIDLKIQNVSSYETLSYSNKDLKLYLEFSDKRRISQICLRQISHQVNTIKKEKQTLLDTPQQNDHYLNSLMILMAGKFSTRLLWRMMAILQLMVSLPLMGTNLPSNVILCFETFIRITSLQIIDKETIKNYAFGYLDSSNDSITDQLQNGDIFQIHLLTFNLNFITLLHDTDTLAFLSTSQQFTRYACETDVYQIQIFIFQEFQEDTQQKFVSISMMAILSFLPVVVYIFLNRNSGKLSEQRFMAKFGTLYLAINPKKSYLVFDSSIFFLRRMIYAVCCIFVVGYGVFQILVTAILTLQILEYQVLFMHLDSKLSNKMEVFNESVFLVITIIILVLVGDLIPDIEMRYQVGWTIVFLAASFFCINVCVIWYKITKRVKKAIKNAIIKIKQRRLIRKQKMTNMGKYLISKHASTPSNKRLLAIQDQSMVNNIISKNPEDFTFFRHPKKDSSADPTAMNINEIKVEQLVPDDQIIQIDEIKQQQVKEKYFSANNLITQMVQKIPYLSILKKSKHVLDSPPARKRHSQMEAYPTSNAIIQLKPSNFGAINAKRRQSVGPINSKKSSLNDISNFSTSRYYNVEESQLQAMMDNISQQLKQFEQQSVRTNDIIDEIPITPRIGPQTAGISTFKPKKKSTVKKKKKKKNQDPTRKLSLMVPKLTNLNSHLVLQNGYMNQNYTPEINRYDEPSARDDTSRRTSRRLMSDYQQY
ncbi:UNKNOWN [Stylonychia lemnae]|uniref:TRP C-terminal domain-containing protein n=1 Tax=Stylonychia lemnae TaxID=5949 RepID=A0A078A6Z2_STYLE|nr:UNKNOWN [Stylonychia lemnae]|eukprot:CDW78009.1 UNKNOWN [Stylonychia lemnae]